MTKIYTLRHFKTNYNQEGLIQGHSNNSKILKLTSEQLKKIVKNFSEIIFDKVYISDLVRTRQTWKILKPYIHTEIEEYTEKLREQAWGLLEGENYNNTIFKKIKDNEPYNNEIYGKLIEKYKIESFASFQKRVDNFFKEISIINKNKKILCITHGGVISLKKENKKIENGKMYLINN